MQFHAIDKQNVENDGVVREKRSKRALLRCWKSIKEGCSHFSLSVAVDTIIRVGNEEKNKSQNWYQYSLAVLAVFTSSDSPSTNPDNMLWRAT